MRKSDFTEAQIVSVLSEGDRKEVSVEELCKKHGISVATYYSWRKRFRGMSVDEAKRYRELERENSKLKRLLAERDLEVDAMRELIQKKF